MSITSSVSWFTEGGVCDAAVRCREPAYVLSRSGRLGVALGGEGEDALGVGGNQLHAVLPGVFPEHLGDRAFLADHGTRFPYVTGSMANGIATVDVVVAAAHAGCLGFFGAAGLAPRSVEHAVDALSERLGPNSSWGCNLIHSPSEPAIEDAVADIYIRRDVRCVEASAFMNLTPAVVRYAYSGLRRMPDGSVERRHRVIAKLSRPEVARKFLEPAPSAIIEHLVAHGLLSNEEATLGAALPLAEDLTVEADSGGHTDRRPLGALFPVIVDLGREIAAHRGWRPPRVGAGGGLGTPASLASAFALGASYVVTGSVNQSCVESGLDPDACLMLSQAELPDVIMAPAADMFELGVDVQVLRRGTMFGTRGRRLYELYRDASSLDELGASDRAWLEDAIFGKGVEDAWLETKEYWAERDPEQFDRAEENPKHKLALLFRSYLGLASRWAIDGRVDRRTDYQIWCSSAMGAFNSWVAGSFLAPPENRTVEQVARNLLEGAAVVTRAQQLRTAGLSVPPEAFVFRPRLLR